ncbi:MAG: flagellar hook-basal body complex protein FliE [Myxococcota bacterium]
MVNAIRLDTEAQAISSATKQDSTGFSKALASVRATMSEADAKSSEAMVGGGSIHTAMIALTKADLSFRFAAQVRNKAVEAYREMMNLQF